MPADTLTPEALAEIERRAEDKSGPTPWEWGAEYGTGGYDGLKDAAGEYILEGLHDGSVSVCAADAEYIASACNSLPALLSSLRAAWAERDGYKLESLALAQACERLHSDVARAETERDTARTAALVYARERDEARAERDALRAEVERLRAEKAADLDEREVICPECEAFMGDACSACGTDLISFSEWEKQKAGGDGER